MSALLTLLGHAYAPVVVGAILSALAWLGRKLVDRHKYLGFLSRVGSYARTAVLATHETYVKEIQKGRADGKLTDAEKAEALKRAKAVLMSFARLDGLSDAVMGKLDEGAADAVIETVLAEQKLDGEVSAVLPQ